MACCSFSVNSPNFGPLGRRLSSYVLKDTQNISESYPLSSQVSNEQVTCASGQQCDNVILDCGKPVNFTYYDNLIGVANRNKHPLVPEPNVALMFKKNGGKTVDVDIDLLERRLKKAKREVYISKHLVYISVTSQCKKHTLIIKYYIMKLPKIPAFSFFSEAKKKQTIVIITLMSFR